MVTSVRFCLNKVENILAEFHGRDLCAREKVTQVIYLSREHGAATLLIHRVNKEQNSMGTLWGAHGE